MTTKRINLSFSIDREDDLKVYRILSEQKYKTDYVIKAVLSYIGERDKEQGIRLKARKINGLED